MTSPIKVYDEVAAKFGITDELNVPTVARLGFAREQAQQMQSIANRLIYDIVTTTIHMEDAKDDASKAAYQAKGSAYENDLRQTKAALVVSLDLVKEFEAKVASEK